MFNVLFNSPVGSLCHTCTCGVVRHPSYVCYGNSRAMPQLGKLNRYSCWGIVHGLPHTHDFHLSVKSPAYLICRTPPLYPELPNGPPSLLERPRYLGLKRNSHLEKGIQVATPSRNRKWLTLTLRQQDRELVLACRLTLGWSLNLN